MKKYIVVILFGLLSGCSSKLAYNNIDWLVYWYMDDYVELNNQQEALFDKQLAGWIDWHRSEELPKYIQHLQQIRRDVAQNKLTESTIITHYQRLTAHWDRFRKEISPPLVDIAETLTDEQVIRLFAALEADNKERKERIAKRQALSPQAQLEKRIEGMVEDMEARIGSLTAQQRQIVTEFAPQFTSSSSLWLAYRRELQQQARRLFATRHNRDDFQEKLLALLLDPEQYRSEAFLAAWEHNRTLQARMAAAIAQTLTAKQKEKLLNHIDDLIEDLKGLSDH